MCCESAVWAVWCGGLTSRHCTRGNLAIHYLSGGRQARSNVPGFLIPGSGGLTGGPGAGGVRALPLGCFGGELLGLVVQTGRDARELGGVMLLA
jgi:hypothetical protein